LSIILLSERRDCVLPVPSSILACCCILLVTYISFRVDILFEICSSSRSIKRRRFDDELVESSLGTSGNLASKMARTRMQSTSSPGLSQYNTTYSSRVPSTPSASCASGQYIMKSLLHVTLLQLLMNKFRHVKRHATYHG